MIARNKKTGESIRVVNLLLFTNINVLPFSEDIPAEVITFLDPTIESLHFVEKDKKTVIYLKLKGKEEIVINNPIELNNYLSSGMTVIAEGVEEVEQWNFLTDHGCDLIQGFFAAEPLTEDEFIDFYHCATGDI